MNRRSFLQRSFYGCSLLSMGANLCSCQREAEFYTPADYERSPKLDAHFHYELTDDAIVTCAHDVGMKLLSINVDAGSDVATQLEVAHAHAVAHPDDLFFLGTFTLEGFGQKEFADRTIAQIEEAIGLGARGIKVWKNIGMGLKDSHGRFVMIDSPQFEPVFSYLEAKRIPLVGHLGEPRNCWLPLEEMTMDNDYRYYSRHPEYHMYHHPDSPSYEEQIAARDRLLDRHPCLIFVGAHLGSMEWSLEQVAQRMDKYPNFYIDLSARIGHVQLQAVQNRDAVRRFFCDYQDRVLYGSDVTISHVTDVTAKCQSLREMWKNQWLYYATNERLEAAKFRTENPPETVDGLQLPRQVVDKLFYANAASLFGLG